ncbi:SHC SH2 domain-binding protein 1 isoform X1 [Alosa sapidissima]|uniref:SHC SH2 domain-binding protein 1 isoform X1 n=1 Tax=Alosa sapidissima TaxID=34773 RepID=UPI001C09E58A|nr:SHC SH2 domain-binding protein 1 isoform X1 [Alosa sapidissima]
MAEEVVCLDVQPQEANVSQTEHIVDDAEIACSESVRKERVDLESEMEMGAVTREELAKDVPHISQGHKQTNNPGLFTRNVDLPRPTFLSDIHRQIRHSRRLFQDDGDGDEDDNDDDSGTDYHNSDQSGTQLQRAERNGHTALPDTFQTNHLIYYERFKAYQDYMLGDCKTSEVKAFTADYLEKVVEPCEWQAVWCTDVFDVLVEVVDVDYKEMKAKVELVLPLQCETRGCELTEDAMRALLEATLHKVPVLELQVVYEETGDFDQTALALEHLRFFYKHIWRKWDEEDEDDDFDYFVRCVEPRLRLYYDILEDRVPAGLVVEYHALLSRCSEKYQEFSSLRNGLSSDSDSELDNVSMVEGLRLYDQVETLKRKLRIIENPLLRYVLGYKVNSGQHFSAAKGRRPEGGRVVHVVCASATVGLLQSLMADKLGPEFSGEEFEVQFHSDPQLAVNTCYEGDVVIVCPGHYNVNSSISIPDSILLEGYGLPDEVVIEKKSKGDTFVECTGASVKISNLKFIQHDAIEGILCVRQGALEMENCVMQCNTTGVIVRTSAQLSMNMCDLYGSKGAGVEIYPGSVCSLLGNGIHHCKEGILIKDFADQLDAMPKITMVNNVIHNNEGYGVILVKPNDSRSSEDQPAKAGIADEPEGSVGPAEVDTAIEMGSSEGDLPEAEIPIIVVEEDCCVASEGSEGNDAIKRELMATSAKKLRLQRSRANQVGSMQADENLPSQEMFVSIQGNQFKRNGKGSFGTFLY